MSSVFRAHIRTPGKKSTQTSARIKERHHRGHMVVPLNRGPNINKQIHYNPDYYKVPNKDTPTLGKPPHRVVQDFLHSQNEALANGEPWCICMHATRLRQQTPKILNPKPETTRRLVVDS